MIVPVAQDLVKQSVYWRSICKNIVRGMLVSKSTRDVCGEVFNIVSSLQVFGV